MVTKVKLIADDIVSTDHLDPSASLTFTDLTLTGDLTVQGTTTTLDTTNLNVEDKNITLNYGSGDTSSNVDGAGITIQDAVDASNDATFNWGASNDRFKLSHGLEVLTGNVGIGRTDPTQLLEVHKSTGGDQTVAKFSAHNYGDTGKTFIEIGTEYGDGSSRIGSFNDTGNSSVLVFDTHSATSGQFTERMRIDASGHVGIGRTPESDYYSTLKVLALGNGPSIYASTSGNPNLTFNDNLFINSAGNNEYQTSNPGTRLEQFNGTLTFSNAPSGTAGQTATLTERFRISSNGSIGVGTTDSTYSMSLQNIVSSDVMLQIKNTTNNEDTGIFIDAIRGGVATNSRIGHSVIAGNELLQITNPNGHAFYTGTSSLTERVRITSGGELQIAGHSGYELGFTGNQTINIRADAGIFMLANTVHSDPYFGLGIGNNQWGQHIMMRTKSSTGTNGSATSYNAVSVGTTAGGSSLGSFNGPEPMAPFHILKGGLTMNGIETAGVTKYAHGNSDSGQWMHMNSAGRSGSGVGNFQLYVPTAVSSGSWGGFGGDLFLSGYNGQHEYIIWRGYTNSGISGGSGIVVSGTGSPTITVGQNGTFGFYINVSNISMTHPIAMYRVCKGGQGGREWDLSEISCRWY